MMNCSHENCKLDAYDNEKCILHSDKKNKNVDKFWQQIRQQVQEQNAHRSILELDIHFCGGFFPQFEKKGLAAINEGANFLSYDEKTFKKKLKLEDCTFWNEADFGFITFEKGLIFNKCTFENTHSCKFDILLKSFN